MADFLKAFLKASHLAREGRPLSAAVALKRALPSPKPVKPKAAPGKGGKRAKKALASRLRRPSPGSFITGAFECPEGSLAYKLYTPKGSSRRRMPLVVMLHGCGQTAADFATGTDMNRLADELGFIVLYPQQNQSANLARCWHWHTPNHQSRGSGEPAVIAALTRHAAALARANPARIYVAGLSAGAGAAAIMGAAYPDIFVAVGVHAGVAQGQIRSLATALSAMRGQHPARASGKLRRPLPTIVFHGDRDRTVHPSNAQAFLTNLERSRPGPLVSQSSSGTSAGGRDFTRKVYKTVTGEVLLEDWTIHGSGHGWSGGRAAGSWTDPAGPQASREMLRFFLARKREV
jgi:poly(hydroxyalkanoate) depolymerase family esterase